MEESTNRVCQSQQLIPYANERYSNLASSVCEDVDGALLISTDAAQQITERAIKRAIGTEFPITLRRP